MTDSTTEPGGLDARGDEEGAHVGPRAEAAHPARGSNDLPDAARFVAWLRGGDSSVIAALRVRCERVAGSKFSTWAWEWIRDDFVADLASQLSNAVRHPDFELRGEPGAYVDTAIRNLCRRYFREVAQRRSHVSLDAVAERRHMVSDTLTQIAVIADLKHALQQLSSQCRELIQRKYVSGESLEEIGRRVGVPAKTARSRLHTCRQRLRRLLRGPSTSSD